MNGKDLRVISPPSVATPATNPATLAETLNAGGKLRWPAGTNALRVVMGSKTAIVLKADVGALKGTGCGQATVEFGYVKYDSQRRPRRNTFVPVAAIIT